MAAAAARAPRAAAARRRAFRVAVATRAYQQAAGLGAALVSHSSASDRPIGRTEPAVSSGSLGRGIRGPLASDLGWAEQARAEVTSPRWYEIIPRS